MSIREVYAGSALHPDSSYVELQMWAPGQNFVGNHSVFLYDASGAPVGTFTFPADLPGEGANQQTMLVGDDGVQAAFGVTPDLVDDDFNVPASGGAACWDALDCVSWGDFHGSTTPSSGVPADGAGIPGGTAILRRISGGTCSNLLDEADDTNDSDGDFANAAPSPQSYATVPPPMSCVPPAPTPTTALDTKPALASNSTEATFGFHSDPPGASFECRLDLGSYVACNSGTITYAGPLTEGAHGFRVRASNANGTGVPVAYSWTVDLTAPEAAITSHPANPSPGKSASFRYSSNEGGSKFECKLKPAEAAFTPCNSQPKVFSSLADGSYEFEVQATDPAGNTQSTPTVFAWTVDNSLLDTTSPETTIVSRPPNPSGSPVASFAYSSNEPGSRFQCKMDGGSFNACPAAGVTYTGLADGSHTFEVRAIDPSENTDPTPAGYSFDVALTPESTGAVPRSASSRSPRSAPPETKLLLPRRKTRDRTPVFRFRSTASGAKFQCKLDHSPFKPCRSPYVTKTLTYGKHVLQVRAIAAGQPDPSPAKIQFEVVRG